MVSRWIKCGSFSSFLRLDWRSLSRLVPIPTEPQSAPLRLFEGSASLMSRSRLTAPSGLNEGGQRWIYRASPGEQSVLIMRTPKGEMRWPILMARLTADKRLRIVIASPNAGKPWKIVLRQLSHGTYRTVRSAPLGNKHVLSVENGIYVENHRPTPPLQRCRE